MQNAPPKPTPRGARSTTNAENHEIVATLAGNDHKPLGGEDRSTVKVAPAREGRLTSAGGRR
jgi:hypothetical protein